MFHKNALPTKLPTHPASQIQNPENATGLSLVPDPARNPAQPALRPSSSVPDLIVITARRCSAFCAEAAVLVLVFGILDIFILRGRIELPWVFGALAISLGLLAASIATDFGAHRWIKAHP